MCVLRATLAPNGLAVLLSIIAGVGGRSSNLALSVEDSPQEAPFLGLVRTHRHNVSTTAHSSASHRLVVSNNQNASALATNSVAKLTVKEAAAINAASKHDRFCEEFCYHMFGMDDEEPTQILRLPCVRGCRRMYSQGAMGSCDCDPFEPPQDPKGGPLKQGSRSGCHTFPDPGQGFNWHASCLDLYDKDHGFVVDQPGYRTPEEVTKKITMACKVGWQCGKVMTSCLPADQLSAEFRVFRNSGNESATDLVTQICS